MRARPADEKRTRSCAREVGKSNWNAKGRHDRHTSRIIVITAPSLGAVLALGDPATMAGPGLINDRGALRAATHLHGRPIRSPQPPAAYTGATPTPDVPNDPGDLPSAPPGQPQSVFVVRVNQPSLNFCAAVPLQS
jgi:hypothetical protein